MCIHLTPVTLLHLFRMTERNFSDRETARAYGAHAHVQEAAAKVTWLEDRPFIDEFLKLIPPGGEVLDVGAGSGNQASYFAQHDLNVAMTEGSPEMLAIARQQASSAEGRVGVLPDIPFEDGRFDGVFSRHVLHHLALSNVEAALKNISRVTKAFGHVGVIMSVSAGAETQQRWWNIEGEDRIQINRYPRDTLRNTFSRLGFTAIIDEIVDEEGVPVLRTIMRKDDVV